MKTVYNWFERCESIQDIEAATTAQLRHSRKWTSRAAPESGKNDGISVFEARGSILMEIMAVCLLL